MKSIRMSSRFLQRIQSSGAGLAAMLALFLSSVTSLLAAPATINLPHTTTDGKNPAWVIHPGGWLQQRRLGEDTTYSQAAMLNVNQNGLAQTNNQAKTDPKTGEIILESFQPIDTIQVSRRIQVRREEEVVRFVDVFRNTGGEARTIDLQYTTSLSRPVTQAQTISDPRKAGADLAWVAQAMRGKTAVEMFGAKGAQLAPDAQWEQGNNVVQFHFQLEVPAGKSVAVMHLHSIAISPEKGAELVNSIRLSRIVGDLPQELKRAIVNFPVSRSFVGDREILRGTLFDVVELRSGDSLVGTLQQPSYQLQTLFGEMELPADRIVGILNVGQFRPRQLLISTEGEMIGGILATSSIDLQLGNGQVTHIPVSQISRVGYRKRPDEPEEWTFDKAMVVLAGGDRMNIELPDQPIEVITRYGALKLAPAMVASIVLVGEEPGVHQIHLANGSRLAGLMTADQLELKLLTTGSKVTLPVSEIAQLLFVPEAPEIASDAASLSLASGDLLAGPLTGRLELITAFDTIELDSAQVRSLTRYKESVRDVQATLWDQTKFSGQLDSSAVTCDLGDGLVLQVPVALINSYSQPSPAPPNQMLQRIETIVAQLGADDWKARDQAQADLIGIGATVVPVLRQLRTAQGPEAQQRIDAIIKHFEKSNTPSRKAN